MSEASANLGAGSNVLPNPNPHPLKKVVAVVGIVTMAAAAGVAADRLASGDGNNNTTTPAAAGVPKAGDACSKANLQESSNNSDRFDKEAFLPTPKSEITNQDQAVAFVSSLFGSDGPLGTKIDTASLAAVEATIGKPAHDGKATDPNYNYHVVFGGALAAYSAPGGTEAARKDCVQAHDTMFTTGQYNGHWADKNETVTEILPVRNSSNSIVDMDFKQVVTSNPLSCIEFIDRGDDQNDGFTSVCIDAGNGREYVKGVTVGKGLNQEQNGPANTQPQNANIGGSGNEQQGTGQNGSRGTGGSAGPRGHNPEAGPGGVTESPAVGPGAPGGPTTPETSPAAPPQTTPETTPPPTSPPETTPPPTSPPTTAPPSTTPTTKGPAPCDPNVAKCN